MDIIIAIGHCPVCGFLNIWKEFRRKCVSFDCEWIGDKEELLDTYEEYTNKKRFERLERILNERKI
jgi:hypothetical protein